MFFCAAILNMGQTNTRECYHLPRSCAVIGNFPFTSLWGLLCLPIMQTKWLEILLSLLAASLAQGCTSSVPEGQLVQVAVYE